MSTRPRKQEQEPATDEVTEVAPGIVRTQLPIDLPGLGHVNCYVIEDERGVALVDPGLPGAATFKAIGARLAAIGVPLRRVHTVIVTHSHPDHWGGAGRVHAETGADIVTHRSFRLMWDPSEPPDVDVEDVAQANDPEPGELDGRAAPRMPWDPPPWGGPGYDVPWRRRARMQLARRLPRLVRTAKPTVRLDDAQTIRLAGREWVAVHTPGHTDDHLCLFDPIGRVMISGDHVLPTITPHIGGFTRAPDPLALFFGSLDKVAAYGADVDIVLPAHGHPFHDLTARAESIKEHHEHRLEVLRSACSSIGRPARVNELSQHLFSARAQGSMADSETFAHLEHLRLGGEARRDDLDDGYEYSLVG